MTPQVIGNTGSVKLLYFSCEFSISTGSKGIKFSIVLRRKTYDLWAGPRIAAEGVTGNLVWDSNLMGWEKDKGNEVSWLESLPKEMHSRTERSF